VGQDEIVERGQRRRAEMEHRLRANVYVHKRKDLDMRKFMTTMAAGSLSALMALTATTPVQAMPFQPINGIQQQSGVSTADIRNVDWRDRRNGWDRGYDRRDDWRRDRYNDRHHSHHGNGAAIIGGLAAGVIIGGAIANSNNNRYYYHNGRRYLRD
jgi:hypothetical protein